MGLSGRLFAFWQSFFCPFKLFWNQLSNFFTVEKLENIAKQKRLRLSVISPPGVDKFITFSKNCDHISQEITTWIFCNISYQNIFFTYLSVERSFLLPFLLLFLCFLYSNEIQMNTQLEWYNKSHVCVTWDQWLTHWAILFISCSMRPPPSLDGSIFKQISSNVSFHL